MRYVYHLGVHKTASTFLQKGLALNHDLLRKRGVFVVHLEMPDAIRRQRKVRRQIENGMTVAANALAETNVAIEQAAVHAGASVIVTSEENQIGQPPYTRLRLSGRASFYENADACMSRVAYGQPADRISAIAYTRRPSRLVPSLYGEGVRRLAIDTDIDGFCNAIDWETFRFSLLLQRLRSALPDAELTLAPMESISDGAPAFFASFCQVLGIDADGLKIPSGPVRPSPDRDQAEALRALAARRFAGEDIKPLRRAARAVLHAAPNPDRPIALSDANLRRAKDAEARDIFVHPDPLRADVREMH